MLQEELILKILKWGLKEENSVSIDTKWGNNVMTIWVWTYTSMAGRFLPVEFLTEKIVNDIDAYILEREEQRDKEEYLRLQSKFREKKMK